MIGITQKFHQHNNTIVLPLFQMERGIIYNAKGIEQVEDQEEGSKGSSPQVRNRMPPHLDNRNNPPPHPTSVRASKPCFFHRNTIDALSKKGKSTIGASSMKGKSTDLPKEGKKGKNNLNINQIQKREIWGLGKWLTHG